MSRLDIDLKDGDGRLVPLGELEEWVRSCSGVLRALGPRGSMVESFRVTFERPGSSSTNRRRGSTSAHGPDVTVHFRSPLGPAGSHGTDYSFIGSRGPTPSAKEIKKHLLEFLPRSISERLEHGKEKLKRVQEEFRELERAR